MSGPLGGGGDFLTRTVYIFSLTWNPVVVSVNWLVTRWLVACWHWCRAALAVHLPSTLCRCPSNRPQPPRRRLPRRLLSRRWRHNRTRHQHLFLTTTVNTPHRRQVMVRWIYRCVMGHVGSVLWREWDVQLVFFISNRILVITCNFELNWIILLYSKVAINKYLLSSFSSFVTPCLHVIYGLCCKQAVVVGS